jgi:outer membrane protein
MNDKKTGSRLWRYGALACFITLHQSAMAGGIPDAFDDPLLSMPPVIAEGARLPGDHQAIACAPVTDFHGALSLGDAVDFALCRNPQIRAAWATIKLQASAVGQARAAYLPTLSGSMSQLRNRTHYPDFAYSDTSNQGQTAYLSLTWRLFDFGGREANREAANRALISALLSHDAALQKTLAATVAAYFDAQTSQAQLQARREAEQVAMRTLSTTTRREQKGAAAQSDVLQARTALAKAQLLAQRAQGDDEKALALLAYAMNFPVSQLLQLQPMSDMPVPDAQEDLQHWLTEAQAHHPGILAARAQVDVARAKIQSARSEGLPSIDLTSNYYRNGYPNQGLQSTRSNTTTWGLTLTIPFFDGFSRTYKIREAQAQVEQNEAQAADVERQILSDVIKAHADAVSSLANLESSASLLDAAQAALASSEKRYARGVADILELLNQQGALADAQQERIRCLAEWRSSRLRLMANTGVLGSRDMASVWRR